MPTVDRPTWAQTNTQPEAPGQGEDPEEEDLAFVSPQEGDEVTRRLAEQRRQYEEREHQQEEKVAQLQAQWEERMQRMEAMQIAVLSRATSWGPSRRSVRPRTTEIGTCRGSWRR